MTLPRLVLHSQPPVERQHGSNSLSYHPAKAVFVIARDSCKCHTASHPISRRQKLAGAGDVALAGGFDTPGKTKRYAWYLPLAFKFGG